MSKKIKTYELPLIYTPSGKSEYACPDGEMYVRAETPVSSEIYYKPEVLQSVKPEPGKLLTIDSDGDSRRLYYEGGLLKWSNSAGGSKSVISLIAGDPLGEVYGAVCVGEIILLATSRGRRWLRCMSNGFRDLGSRLPSPQITYTTVTRAVSEYYTLGVGWPTATLVMTLDSADMENVRRMLTGGNGRFKGVLSDKGRGEIDSTVRGMLDDYIRKVTDRRLFIGPFNIVRAFSFFDGSHSAWSEPVRINPNGTDGVAQGIVITDYEITGNVLRTSVEIRSASATFMAHIASVDTLSQWEGIIEGIDFFITPEMPVWNMDEEVSGITHISKQPAWNAGRYDANTLTRMLQENEEYRLMAQMPLSSILMSNSQNIPISFESRVAVKSDIKPDFGWESNLIPSGVGKISSSVVVWGKNEPTVSGGVKRLSLEVAAPGNPFVWASAKRRTPDVGDILAVVPAIKSLSSGQLGEFPSYMFTSTGVWALRVDTDGDISVAQTICSYVPFSARQIVAVAEGVVFSTGRGVLFIRGSSVTILSDSLNKSLPDAKMDSTFLKSCILTTDRDTDRVFVENGDELYCYDFVGDRWLKPESMAVKPGLWIPDSLSPGLYPDIFGGNGSGAASGGGTTEGGATRYPTGGDDGEKNATVRETRTLKFGGAAERKRVLTVEVVAEGEWKTGEKIRLYGADLPGKWSHLGTAAGRRLGRLTGTPRRFHKITFEGFSTPPIAIILKVQE